MILPLQRNIFDTVPNPTVVATQTIPAFSAVTSQGQLGSSSNFSHIGKIIGIAIEDIQVGFSGTVQNIGDLTNPLWSWTPGDVVFLNGTAFQNFPPEVGFAQVMGMAKTSQTISVYIGSPIQL